MILIKHAVWSVITTLVLFGCGGGSDSGSNPEPSIKTFDARLRNLSLKQTASTVNTNGSISTSTTVINRDSTGKITSEVTTPSLGNVITKTYTYDSAGRILTIQKGVVTTVNTYNAAGNIQTKIDNGTGSSYTYDPAGILRSSTATLNGSSATSTYVYDSNNNITSVVIASSGSAALSWQNGLLISFISSDVTDTYHDSTTFTYDSAKKLTTVVNSIFDGSTTTNTATSYTYNTDSIVEIITTANSITTNTYTFDGGVPVFDFYRSSSGLIFNGGLWINFMRLSGGIT